MSESCISFLKKDLTPKSSIKRKLKRLHGEVLTESKSRLRIINDLNEKKQVKN